LDDVDKSVESLALSSPSRYCLDYHYDPMDSSTVSSLAEELHRRAVEKFGSERAEALRGDLLQLARELEAINSYEIGFEDAP
jgi:hypothetical protein